MSHALIVVVEVLIAVGIIWSAIKMDLSIVLPVAITGLLLIGVLVSLL